ncbi:MAG: LON peptidase substrate-binding domain-containing protein, partial [Myxococcota bacterium]
MARKVVSAEIDQRDDFAELPDQLPLLPVRDIAVFPFMVVPLFVSRPISLAAVEEALAADRRLFLVAQRDPQEANPSLGDLYAVGTLGKILRVQRQPDAQVKILVQGLRRIRMQRVLREQPALVVRPEPLPGPGQSFSQQQIEGAIRAVKDSLKRLEQVGKGLPEEVMTVLMGLNEPGALADLVASNLSLKVSDAQRVLETNAPMGRLSLVNDMLAREAEVMAWQQKIQTQAKAEMSRTQREYFLREQLKQIRQELGDVDGRQEDFTELRERLAKAGLPSEADRESQKQLRRLESMSSESAEASVCRTYLDWLADVPWQSFSEDRIELREAQRILDEEHYGLEPVKDRILEYLGVLKLKGDQQGPILCFVGPPGVGKTSIGRSIARALGRAFVRISLGGVHDESEIRGHRRTYVGAMPGRIISGLKQAGTRNPVFMLDELDKMGRDGRGDPAAALLEVLDPEQNSTFRDHYLNLPFDLSRVMWVATANVVESMAPALRDRMEIIE